MDALHEVVSDLLELSFDALTTPERLGLLERLDHETRRLPVAGSALINQLRRRAGETELGGKLAHALANRLRISRAEAGRRIHEAEDLGPRQSVTGEPLPPRLAATAAAQRAGQIGAGHVAVIRRFVQQLPEWVDAATRDKAEAKLARQGAHFRPDELAKLADKLADCLNPVGNFTDEDRARRRGLILGNQQADGTSSLSGWLTPAARAALEAVWARLAAPGMANPSDATLLIHDAEVAEVLNDIRDIAEGWKRINGAIRRGDPFEEYFALRDWRRPTGKVPDGWPDRFDGLVDRPTTYGREGHRLHAHPGGLQRSKHHLAEHLRAGGVFIRLS
ncbi:MAG: hypothetical protein QOE94_750 [Mycobacterium sp.]|nr:hypothetical protein [Mycobacterium sp.]